MNTIHSGFFVIMKYVGIKLRFLNEILRYAEKYRSIQQPLTIRNQYLTYRNQSIICRAYQSTGFHMSAAWVLNGLKRGKHS